MIEYQLEYYNEEKDDYEYIDLEVGVTYQEEVGTNQNICYFFEINSCKDKGGKDWIDSLSKYDIENIKNIAMNGVKK